MAKKGYTPEQIINKLREAEKLILAAFQMSPIPILSYNISRYFGPMIFIMG